MCTANGAAPTSWSVPDPQLVGSQIKVQTGPHAVTFEGGCGLNLATGQDSVKAVAVSGSCAGAAGGGTSAVNDLGPNDSTTATMATANFTWSDTGLYMLCYRMASSNTYVKVGKEIYVTTCPAGQYNQWHSNTPACVSSAGNNDELCYGLPCAANISYSVRRRRVGYVPPAMELWRSDGSVWNGVWSDWGGPIPKYGVTDGKSPTIPLAWYNCDSNYNRMVYLPAVEGIQYAGSSIYVDYCNCKWSIVGGAAFVKIRQHRMYSGDIAYVYDGDTLLWKSDAGEQGGPTNCCGSAGCEVTTGCHRNHGPHITSDLLTYTGTNLMVRMSADWYGRDNGVQFEYYLCPPGYYCPDGTDVTPLRCPAGCYCGGGSQAPTNCSGSAVAAPTAAPTGTPSAAPSGTPTGEPTVTI